ncbi:hypothetical protein J6590_079623 [Homalodisca vitripennis]|nr:hypothetical protein J6590_079623 [Homalodisca vitripennis]
MLDFKLLEVKNCCYCLKLKTGIKIIGFFSLTESITLFLHFISTFTVYTLGTKRVINLPVPYVLYYTAFHFIDLFTSFLLLLGVYQEKPEMMRWWLGFTLVSVVLECVMPSILIRGLEIVLYYPYYLLTPLSLIYNMYGLLVVFSYYRILIRRREVELSAPAVQLSQVLEAD